MINLIGTIGATLLALCGLPQAIQCIRTKTATGISWAFLLAWFIGEIGVLIYTLDKQLWMLSINYLMNMVIVLIMLYYKTKDLQNGVK